MPGREFIRERILRDLIKGESQKQKVKSGKQKDDSRNLGVRQNPALDSNFVTLMAYKAPSKLIQSFVLFDD